MVIGTTRIKICGLTNIEDLEHALALGVEMVGFVAAESSPRFVEPNARAALIKAVARRADAFEVFARENPVPASRDSWLQAASKSFPQDRPFARNVYVHAVDINRTPDHAPLPSCCGSILLDASVDGAIGGTGQRLDWDWAAQVIAGSPIPVGLAGGLNANNVAEAVRLCRPAWVDVSSGVEERPGKKSREMLAAFVAEVRASTAGPV